MAGYVPAIMLEKSSAQLSRLPSVSRLLNEAAAGELIAAYGAAEVTAAVRNVLQGRRDALKLGNAADIEAGAILDDVAGELAKRSEPSLRPVFNLTGTVLHTNLGRAFLPQEAIDAIAAVSVGASNLEYDLEGGRRGDRDSHVEGQICEITGAQAATVVNNNAAAVMLVLNTLALGREVPVSRGELVEIGGSFRIPDIMTRSGCRLVEVGTTNRTHAKDFERAIGPDTAMIMKVHTSNYTIEGFTAEVPETQLAEICRANDLPFVNDLGSGTLTNLDDFGLPHEPTPMDALRDGADVVTFSGDKLLGGPQAGIVVGREDLIARIKSNPMKRALRCDKMTIAALSAVLQLYKDPARLAQRLPVLAALTRPLDDIEALAQRMLPALQGCLGHVADITVIVCESEIGSGALPTRTIESAGIAIRPRAGATGEGTMLARIGDALRSLPRPVVGYVRDGAMVLDLRCLSDEEGFVAQLDRLEISA